MQEPGTTSAANTTRAMMIGARMPRVHIHAGSALNGGDDMGGDCIYVDLLIVRPFTWHGKGIRSYRLELM